MTPGRSREDAFCGFIGIDPQRVVIDVNAEAARLLGYAKSELVGRKFSAILAPPSRIFMHTQVFPSLAVNDRIDELYLSLLTASGAELPVLLNVGRAREGEAFGYDSYFMPVRRRHLFERELVRVQRAAETSRRAEEDARSQVRAMQEQLAINERLVALGTLAAGVAHEINNPLTYVYGNLSLLGEIVSDLRVPQAVKSDVLGMLADANDGVARIRAIVASLKSLSRVDAAERRSVDLSEVIQAALRLCVHEYRGRAVVTVDVPVPHPCVKASEGQLVQVVLNLVVNAAHALPGRAPADNRISVSAHHGEGHAELVVEDNGPGVPDEAKTRIFDPFFTTKPVGQGTGLGLSVCHNIVTGLGGRIAVEDAPAGGARFVVSLPAGSEPCA